MRFAGGNKKVSLCAVSGGMAHNLVKFGIEGNRVQRHLDIDRRGELRPDSSHALAGGPFALGTFPLDDQHVLAPGGGEVVSNAGADNPSADDHNVCCLHEELLHSKGGKITTLPQMNAGWRGFAQIRS